MSSEGVVILTVGLPPNHRAFQHKPEPKLLEAVESQLKALPGQLADAGFQAKNVFMGPGVCWMVEKRIFTLDLWAVKNCQPFSVPIRLAARRGRHR